MPMELQIIRAADFIRLGPQGHIDLETSRQYLLALAKACRRRGVSRALVDIRDLVPGPKPRLSPTEMASLINCFREMGFCESDRIAILYLLDPHRAARIFAFIGELHGWNVKAFNDFEQAVAWLFEGEENAEPANMAKGALHMGRKLKKRPTITKSKSTKSKQFHTRMVSRTSPISIARSRAITRRA